MIGLLLAINALLVVCCGLPIFRTPISGFKGETFTVLYEDRFDGFTLWTSPDAPPGSEAKTERVNRDLQEWFSKNGYIGSAPVRITIGRPE